MAGLRDPSPIVEATQNVGVLPGDALGGPEQETAAVAMTLVQLPPVGAVEGVLSHGGGKEGGQGDQGELHGAVETGQRLSERWRGEVIIFRDILKLIYLFCH